MNENYLSAVDDLYREAAEAPMSKLCCTTSPVWRMPGLNIPTQMLEMNYGCGTTVNAKDLGPEQTVLYVGVGGGMEALQFAYFTRRPSSVIAVDTVDEMMDKARANLEVAALENDWFSPEFVDIRRGNALDLPIESGSVDTAAQNCLFNIFTREHLLKALTEMHRVLKPHGRLIMSDPVATRPMPDHLAADDRLRAECISGAVTLDEYLATMVKAGFGTIELRSKVPYRLLDKERYGLDAHLLLESIEVCAIKDPVPEDGACIFTGRTATYFGKDEVFDDGKGHTLVRDMPLNVCDKTAGALEALGRGDLFVTGSTYFYGGGGCC
ncbi:MAG: arsenosugar biosynthesis arsenite methyltransferase ArsM [Deltaproteobacteria bacterium]|jgi:SAM-dependent methyltransferase